MALNTKYITLISGGVAAIAGGSYGAYYLSQDKTIRDRLISSGEALISSQEEYLDGFKKFKDIQDFINLIKGNDIQISETGDENKGKEAFKTWCEKNLNTSLSDKNSNNLIENTKRYCTTSPTNIEGKIKKLGKKWVTNWNNKFDSLKQPTIDSELAEDLKSKDDKVQNLENPSKDLAIKALEGWCKDQGSKQLLSEGVDKIWKKVERRCIESSSST